MSFFQFAVLLFTATIGCSSCTKNNPQDSGNPDRPPTTPAPYKVTVSTVAGKRDVQGEADGNGLNASFWNPAKMAYDGRNNTLYIADGTVIRSMDAQNNVKTYMPSGFISRWSDILDMCIAPGSAGSLYITTSQFELLKIEPSGSSVKKTVLTNRTYGGNETGLLNQGDQLDGAHGVATGAHGEIYFFNAFWNTLRRIRLTSLSPAEGTVEAFAGKPTNSRSGDAWPFANGQGEAASFGSAVSDITSDAQGTVYVADEKNHELRMVTPGAAVSSLLYIPNPLYGKDVDGPVSTARANGVTQVSCSQDGSLVFFSTYGEGSWSNSPALRAVKGKKEVITLVGSHKGSDGDGPGESATFDTIGGIACTPDGKTIYVAEPYKKVIRKITLE